MNSKILVGCVVTAVIGVTVAPALLFGASANTPPPSHFARELAALSGERISAADASRAIGIQEKITQTDLIGYVQGALGDAYAGVWFEPATAQLHVGVTSPASRRAVERLATRAGLGANVVETQVRSTWAELLAAQRQLNSKLATLFAHAEAETAPIPQHNAVSVVLSSSVPSAERASIARYASTTGVHIRFAVVPGSQLRLIRLANTTECNDFQANKAFCNKPITPGVTIRNAAGLTCTAGPLAFPKTTKTRTYLLTAGHCIQAGGGVGQAWFALNRAGARAEIGRAVELVNNSTGDIGAILVNTPGEWTLPGGSSVFAVVAQWNLPGELQSYRVNGLQLPVVGFLNCKEGQTTGETCGKIAQIGGAIDGIEGVVADEKMVASGGDSGAPFVAVATKQGLFLEGTLIGLVTLPTSDNILYEPLDNAFLLLKGLNLELLTILNECRSSSTGTKEWSVNGHRLESCTSEPLNSLPKVDSSLTLSFKIASSTIAILCGGIHLINGRILPPNIDSIEKIDFLNCHTISPTPTACQLTGGQTTLTLIVTNAVQSLQKSGTRVALKPELGKVLAEIPFEEGTVCALEGLQPVKGEVVAGTPTAETEATEQGLVGLGSEENNSLEVATVKSFLLGKILLSLQSGLSWSFK